MAAVIQFVQWVAQKRALWLLESAAIALVWVAVSLLRGTTIDAAFIARVLPVLAICAAMGFGQDISDLSVHSAVARAAIFAIAAVLAVGIVVHAISPRPLGFSNLDYILGPALVCVCFGVSMIVRHPVRNRADEDADSEGE